MIEKKVIAKKAIFRRDLQALHAVTQKVYIKILLKFTRITTIIVFKSPVNLEEN